MKTIVAALVQFIRLLAWSLTAFAQMLIRVECKASIERGLTRRENWMRELMKEAGDPGDTHGIMACRESWRSERKL